MLAASLDDLRKSKDSPLRFQPVDKSESKQFSQNAQEFQKFRAERQKLETTTASVPAEARTKESMPAKVKLPGSPIVAKAGSDLGKDHVPPKVNTAPKPDPTVTAKARVNRSVDQPQQRTVNKVPVDQPQTQPTKAPQTQPQPKAERVASQPPPQAERSPQQPHGKDAAGSKQDPPKGKDTK